MGGTGDGGSELDEGLLRLVAGRLGQLTFVERVSIFPASKLDSEESISIPRPGGATLGV